MYDIKDFHDDHLNKGCGEVLQMLLYSRTQRIAKSADTPIFVGLNALIII